MVLKIQYNDTEITEDIQYTSILMYDRLGGELDNVLIRIPTDEKSKIAEDIIKGDEIRITTDDFTSGVMYVDEYSADDSTFVINAISLDPAKKKPKTKIWRDVKLSEIMLDVAINYGLSLKTYGITDYTYGCVMQFNETDISMLSRICKREGYVVKIDNDFLIVFSELYMETESEPVEIDLSDSNVHKRYSFVDSNKCAYSYTVMCFDTEGGQPISQTVYDYDMPDGRELKKVEYVSGFDEANRFARGYLRDINKYRVTGRFSMEYNPKISAGTLLRLTGFGEFDGDYMAYEVAHDVVQEVTRIKVRTILDY